VQVDAAVARVAGEAKLRMVSKMSSGSSMSFIEARTCAHTQLF
jgi:hypothetical protein